MESKLAAERSGVLVRDDLGAIKRRVDALGAMRVPIELSWMRRDLCRLVLELSRWQSSLDRLITVADKRLQSTEQQCASGANDEEAEVSSRSELQLLLAQERYAALQEVRLELLGAMLPPSARTGRP